MSLLILTKGLPYSGKSRWSEQWVQQKPNRIRLSWRDLRRMMGGPPDRKHTYLAVNVAVRSMIRALNDGWDVVLDEPNLYQSEFSIFVAHAQLRRHKVQYQYIKAEPQVCKERCLAAGGSTADCMRIDRLWEVYRPWLEKR